MARINAKAFGAACGTLWGGSMVILGLIDAASTWGDAWGQQVASVYLGYTPTVLGAIIIGVWGYVTAGIWGVALAWLYNKFSKA